MCQITLDSRFVCILRPCRLSPASQQRVHVGPQRTRNLQQHWANGPSSSSLAPYGSLNSFGTTAATAAAACPTAASPRESHSSSVNFSTTTTARTGPPATLGGDAGINGVTTAFASMGLPQVGASSTPQPLRSLQQQQHQQQDEEQRRRQQQKEQRRQQMQQTQEKKQQKQQKRQEKQQQKQQQRQQKCTAPLAPEQNNSTPMHALPEVDRVCHPKLSQPGIRACGPENCRNCSPRNAAVMLSCCHRIKP